MSFNAELINENFQLDNTINKNCFNAETLIENEKKYLLELQRFLTQITPKNLIEKSETQNEIITDWINQAIYYFTVNFGIFKTFLESFVSLKVTLDSFNFLSNSATNLISLAFGLLNLILFYAFEVSLIRESLNIEASVGESIELLHLYQEQLDVAKDINQVFFNRNNPNSDHSNEKYNNNIDFIKGMNKSFKDKIVPQQPLSLPKQALKYSLYTLGAISCVVGEYFVSQYMLQALNDIINLTPIVHWILTGLWLTYVLATYNALSGSSVLSLVNPEYAKLKELNTQYQAFQKQIKINDMSNSNLLTTGPVHQ